MKTEYKNQDINYHEDTNKWRVSTGDRYDEFESFDSLKSAKAYIDRLNKIKYVHVEVWILQGSSWSKSGFDKIKQCTATRPHHAKKFWINFEGSRSSEYSNGLYLDTPENRKKFPMIAEFEKQIKELNNKKDELIKSLETLKEMRKVD